MVFDVNSVVCYDFLLVLFLFLICFITYLCFVVLIDVFFCLVGCLLRLWIVCLLGIECLFVVVRGVFFCVLSIC